MNYLDILHAQLAEDEGVRSKPYPDTEGKLTIGCGRNLTDNGVSRGEIALMFDNDLAKAEATARILVPSFDALSDVRKAVVINMAFNLGFNKFAQFTKTLQAIQERHWDQAAAGMMASRWAVQVGPRAVRLADSMRTNTWKPT